VGARFEQVAVAMLVDVGMTAAFCLHASRVGGWPSTNLPAVAPALATSSGDG
jgi:hypothetical protein